MHEQNTEEDFPVKGAGERYGAYDWEKFIETVDVLRDEPDEEKRVQEFVSAYIRLVGFEPEWVADIDRLLLYFNLDAGLDEKSRWAQIVLSLMSFSRNFDHKRLFLSFVQWEETKERFLDNVLCIDMEALYYVKGETPTGAIREGCIDYEDVAFILYLITNLNYHHYDTDDVSEYCFPYEYAKEQYELKFKRILYGNAFSRILELLQEAKLIEKVGEDIEGLKGDCYLTTEDIIDILGS